MPFRWSPDTGRYRDTARGQFVRDSTVRGALDTVLDVQAATMRDITSSLVDGRLSLSAWQVQMMQLIKDAHLVGLALGNGGWASLDQSAAGWVGQRIRAQYQYLSQFAADLASGKQKLDGTVLARATLYAEAGRQTHRAAIQRAAEERGMEQEKNVLGAADHCPGCLSATAAGWVPIGTLVPCGSRNCLSRCRCSIQYRIVKAPALAA